MPLQPSSSAQPPRRHESAPAPGTVLGPHYGRCFACGDQHETGLHLRMVALDGVAVRCSFVITEHHMGAPGLAHGGILASALDEALGSLSWLMRMTAVTAHLEVDYVRPVPVGRTVVIDARCIGVDGRKIYVEGAGRLDSEEGEVAVRGSGMFLAVSLDHFASYAGPFSAVEVSAGSEGPFNP